MHLKRVCKVIKRSEKAGPRIAWSYGPLGRTSEIFSPLYDITKRLVEHLEIGERVYFANGSK